MSTFTVSDECLSIGLRAGAIIFRDVQISAAPAELVQQINSAVASVRDQFSSRADIRRLIEIARHHEILRNVGVKPKSNPPSTQKLLEYALKRNALPSVNGLVDTYNLVSIRSRCSLGAHDLDRIALPIELRLFRGDESFRPLGSDDVAPIRDGEFGYVDASDRVLCRLDSLQSEFSKVSDLTKNVLLIIEATTDHTPEQIDAAFRDVQLLIEQFCGGSSEVIASAI